jgi:hypothetical protein
MGCLHTAIDAARIDITHPQHGRGHAGSPELTPRHQAVRETLGVLGEIPVRIAESPKPFDVDERYLRRGDFACGRQAGTTLTPEVQFRRGPLSAEEPQEVGGGHVAPSCFMVAATARAFSPERASAGGQG